MALQEQLKIEKAPVDDAFQTDDTEALNIAYDLTEKQKLHCGLPGINTAIKLAKNGSWKNYSHYTLWSWKDMAFLLKNLKK